MTAAAEWQAREIPRAISVPAHGCSVVTCLLISHDRVITASDDHSINVHDPLTGQLIHNLHGHAGGVWSLATTRNTLVSGSTDRTVRIWDLEKGRCTHTFREHYSTVRCLVIVKPEVLDITTENGKVRKEIWPKRSLIVTGSRDHTLQVWKLPKAHEPEYFVSNEEESDQEVSIHCPLEPQTHNYRSIILIHTIFEPLKAT